MGISERRERERQQVRTKILDAARELFARDGFEAVTMRKIADAIEYSPTTIYLHFEDKESLVRELCATDFLSLAKAFRRIARVPDPLERLRKIGLAYVDFGLKHPKHYELMFMRPPMHGPDDEKSLTKGNPEEDAYAMLLGTVSEAMEKGLLREDLSDPALVAQMLWANAHGPVALHVARSGDSWVEWRPVKRIAQAAIDSMLRGIARPGAAPATRV